jgi:hypothetical protein
MTALAAALGQSGGDKVTLLCSTPGPAPCPAGVENGVLLVAKTKTKTYTSSGSTVAVGNVNAAYSQVVAFRVGAAPAILTSATWTNNADTVSLQFPLPVEVPVKVWVICPDQNCGAAGPPVEQEMAGFLADSNAVLDEERVGVELVAAGAGWVSDVTQNPPLRPFRDFLNDQCADLNKVAQDNGWKTPQVVNIYLTRLVDGGPGNGYHCPVEDIVVAGMTTLRQTRLHEVGHALSLRDVDAATIRKYDPDENYMRSESNRRKYFNEGQIFRIHFNVDSFLNKDLGTHPAAVSRDCGVTTADAASATPPCPSLGTWIWPDQ